MLNVNFVSDLQASIDKLIKLPERLPMTAGRIVANQIRTFTHEYSMTPDGATFAPYVPAYAKRRQRMGLQISKVDLKISGEYGRDIQPRAEGDEIIVAPKDSDMKRAAGLSKKRPHIGIAPETPGIIEAAMQKIFEEL